MTSPTLSAALKEFREEITAIRICCNLGGEPNCAECGKQMDKLVTTFAEKLLREAREVQCEVFKNAIGHPSEKTGGGYCSCICHATREVTEEDIDAALKHVDAQIGGAVKRLD